MNNYDDHQVQVALRNQEEILTCEAPVTSLELELGRALLECKTGEFYRIHGYETLRSYLASLDISLKRGYRAMRVYEFYVERMALPFKELKNISTSKLDVLRRVVTKENWAEWKEKLQLSYSDLVEELTEIQGQQSSKGELIKKGIGGFYKLVRIPGYEPPTERGEKVKGRIWQKGDEIVVNI